MSVIFFVFNSSYIFTERVLQIGTLLHSKFTTTPWGRYCYYPRFLTWGSWAPEYIMSLFRVTYLEHNQCSNRALSDARASVQTTPLLKLSGSSSVWVFLKLGTSKVTFWIHSVSCWDPCCSHPGIVKQGPQKATWPLVGTWGKTSPSVNSTLPFIKYIYMCYL